jgi:broad specificity phosphatase PhoE
MNKLVLIRHGQSMGNAWDGAYESDPMNFLTPMGIAQAEVAGWKLKYTGLKFTHMVSSNLTRARQTMAIIAHIVDDWKRPFTIIEGFNERNENPKMDYRQLEFETLYHRETVKKTYDYFIPNLLKDGNVMLVSHHYTMEILFKHLELPMPEVNGAARIPNSVPFIVDLETKEIVALNDATKTPILE